MHALNLSPIQEQFASPPLCVNSTEIKKRISEAWEIYVQTELEIPSRHPKVYSFYEAPEVSNMPGVTNLIGSIFDAKHTFKSLLESKTKEDWESYRDAVMRLLAIPCAFLNAACTASYSILILLHGTKAVKSLSKLASLLGILLCSIESIVEGVNIRRQVRLKNHFIKPIREILKYEYQPQKWLPSVQKLLKEHPESYPEFIEKGVLERIEAFSCTSKDYISEEFIALKALILSTALESIYQKYFTLTEKELNQIMRGLEKENCCLENLNKKTLFAIFEKKISAKKTKLTRRVRPWLVREMDLKAISIIKELNNGCTVSKLRGIELSKKLFQKIDTQNLKKIIRHSIGIAALAFTIAGLILALAGLPYLIPFIIITLGFAFGILRWAIGKGLLDKDGWDLDYKKLLPNFILRLLHISNITTHYSEVEETEIDILLRELAKKEIELIKKKIEQV